MTINPGHGTKRKASTPSPTAPFKVPRNEKDGNVKDDQERADGATHRSFAPIQHGSGGEGDDHEEEDPEMEETDGGELTEEGDNTEEENTEGEEVLFGLQDDADDDDASSSSSSSSSDDDEIDEIDESNLNSVANSDDESDSDKRRGFKFVEFCSSSSASTSRRLGSSGKDGDMDLDEDEDEDEDEDGSDEGSDEGFDEDEQVEVDPSTSSSAASHKDKVTTSTDHRPTGRRKEKKRGAGFGTNVDEEGSAPPPPPSTATTSTAPTPPPQQSLPNQSIIMVGSDHQAIIPPGIVEGEKSIEHPGGMEVFNLRVCDEGKLKSFLSRGHRILEEVEQVILKKYEAAAEEAAAMAAAVASLGAEGEGGKTPAASSAIATAAVVPTLTLHAPSSTSITSSSSSCSASSDKPTNPYTPPIYNKHLTSLLQSSTLPTIRWCSDSDLAEILSFHDYDVEKALNYVWEEGGGWIRGEGGSGAGKQRQLPQLVTIWSPLEIQIFQAGFQKYKGRLELVAQGK